MRPRDCRLTLLVLVLLVRPASGQLSTQLPFKLAEMLPRMMQAAGGERAWAGLRDLSMLQTREQLATNGKVRASEDLRVWLQTVPHVRLLMARRSAASPVYQGWNRGAPWLVEQGLRVHDRHRLEATRTELLESLLLYRLPFGLHEAVTGRLVYEGVFEFEGRSCYRVRFPSGEYPGGDVWLLVDSRTWELRCLAFYGKTGVYQEVLPRRWYREHGVSTPWVLEFRSNGKLTRRDRLRELLHNQWFSPGVFVAEAWMKRYSHGLPP
ncbi:MAG: hypothetical protein HY814_07500 [Candidatus Riflebacteria bacterium]|nr:hypothetical protein [Candidatus Riflebacteria bacterium]